MPWHLVVTEIFNVNAGVQIRPHCLPGPKTGLIYVAGRLLRENGVTG
jgi:hypothetical protein